MKLMRRTDSVTQACSCTSCVYKTEAQTFRQNNLQVDGSTAKDRASDTGNVLKRCFCTLQLHESAQQKYMLHKHLPLNINVQYPQTITVDRVEVEPFYKNFESHQRNKETKNVATKINKKYVRNKDLRLSQWDPYTFPEYKKNLLKKKNVMETILAYTPSKFNRKESKIALSDLRRDLDQSKHVKTPNGTTKSDKYTKLPMKSSLNKLNRNSSNNSFLYRFSRMFSKQTKPISKTSGRQKIKKYDQPVEFKFTVIPKKENPKYSNIAAAGDKKSPTISHTFTDSFQRQYSRFQSGDAGRNIIIRPQESKTRMLQGKQSKRVKNYDVKQPKVKVTFGDSKKHSNNSEDKSKNIFRHKSSKLSKLCYSCSIDTSTGPLRSDNLKQKEEKRGVFYFLSKYLKIHYKKHVTNSKSANYQKSKGTGHKGFSFITSNKYVRPRERLSKSANVERRPFQRNVEQNRSFIKRDKMKCCLRKCSSNSNQYKKERAFNKRTNRIKLSQSEKKSRERRRRQSKRKLKNQGTKVSVPAKGRGGNNKSSKKGKVKPCTCRRRPCAKKPKKHCRKPKSKVTFSYGKRRRGGPICTRKSKRQKRGLVVKLKKNRKFKRKLNIFRRDLFDYKCNFYLDSLRKKPCVCLYYKCPRFYPYFLTMLQMYKQFTDAVLFLLAAAVWSPCILCMECCRALMCCFCFTP